MIPLDVFSDLEQSGFGDLLTPEELRDLLRRQRETTAKIVAVGLLRHGTDGGRAVVHVLIRLPDGTPVLAETSLRLAVVAALALRGTPTYAEEDLPS